MIDAISLVIFFGLLAFNTLFLLFKRKSIEIIVVQLCIMLFTIYVSATLVFPNEAILGVFLALIAVVEFIGSVLMVEV